jgi:hypothetical protein
MTRFGRATTCLGIVLAMVVAAWGEARQEGAEQNAAAFLERPTAFSCEAEGVVTIWSDGLVELGIDDWVSCVVDGIDAPLPLDDGLVFDIQNQEALLVGRDCQWSVQPAGTESLTSDTGLADVTAIALDGERTDPEALLQIEGVITLDLPGEDGVWHLRAYGYDGADNVLVAFLVDGWDMGIPPGPWVSRCSVVCTHGRCSVLCLFREAICYCDEDGNPVCTCGDPWWDYVDIDIVSHPPMAQDGHSSSGGQSSG